jgi:S1-C subfamily serine protease
MCRSAAFALARSGACSREMSQSERRVRGIAVGFAVIALAIALVAGIVTWRTDRRSDAHGRPGRHVAASALVKLGPGAVEQSDGGVRVTDAALRTALGLVDGDTITAISGRRVTLPHELPGVLRELGIYRPRSLFIDLIRDREPVLERWELDGDLDGARRAAIAAAEPGASDPLIATVRQINDTTYEVPRATVEAWTADPALVTSGGRGVPVLGMDEQSGFKLYAIRPGSTYAALGLQNGDVVRALNGTPIASGDQILVLVARSTRQITLDIVRRGQTIILNYLIK